VVNLGLPVIGVVLASRRPENRIGWLFLAAVLLIGLYSFGLSYAVRAVFVAPGSLPLGQGIAWVGTWMLVIAIGLLPLPLVPHGSPPLAALASGRLVDGRLVRAVHSGHPRLVDPVPE
jgi:hypothetical protein